MEPLFASGAARHSILDLAPLELDCMNALWPLGEATVRDIQQALTPIRPRAYTTIMTILDRLARKGVVQRRKTGRAWIYRANVSENEARSRAVTQLVNGFFEGSADALSAHLSSSGGVVAVSIEGRRRAEPPADAPRRNRQASIDAPVAQPERVAPAGLETTLL